MASEEDAQLECAPASTAVLLSQLLLDIGIDLEKLLGQHDGPINRNGQTTVPAPDHDGDDDELRQNLEATAERIVVLRTRVGKRQARKDMRNDGRRSYSRWRRRDSVQPYHTH